MPERDIEYLTLHTFQKAISDATGIATGYISMKMPDDEFVSLINGVNNNSDSDAQYKFPRIGVRYFGKVKYSSNTVGDIYLKDMGNGTAISYEPEGEISFPVSVYLSRVSRIHRYAVSHFFSILFFCSIFSFQLSCSFTWYSSLPSFLAYSHVSRVLS
jgi:hypothetical protein